MAGSAEARYASIVIDFETGQVLHAVNADTRNYPASLTKMMTLYLAFEALGAGTLRMDQRLRISARAEAARPSKLGLRRGATISTKEAILAMITKSANDAAVVIAEAIAGSESKFGRLMTKKARELGMKRTTFRNASGLPNRRQLSTARDMASLAKRLLTDFPTHYHHFSTLHFSYEGRRYKNHNALLTDYPGVDGMKTGYTRASGYNLVVSASRQGRRVIGVVFGGRTASARNRRMRRLLNRAFAKLEPRKQTGRQVASATARPAPPARKPAMTPRLRKPFAIADQATADAPPYKMGWSIQVGAFTDRDPARQAATMAARQLPAMRDLAQVAIVPTRIGDELIYRARLVGLSKSNADEACRRLKSQRVSCVPVPPLSVEGDAAPEQPAR